MHPSFGKGVDWSEHITNAMAGLPKTKVSSARLWLLHRYETDYGIYNHDIDKNPMSIELCGQHWSEDYSLSVGYTDRLREFVDLKVAKYMNIGFTEFLSYPRELVEATLKICLEKEKAGESTGQRLQEELDNLAHP